MAKHTEEERERGGEIMSEWVRHNKKECQRDIKWMSGAKLNEKEREGDLKKEWVGGWIKGEAKNEWMKKCIRLRESEWLHG